MKYIKKFENITLESSLIYNIEHGEIKFVEKLIEDGANINYKEYSQWPPLLLAASYDRVEITELLLKAGADVNITNTERKTALMVASRRTKLQRHNIGLKIVRLLIDADADWNIIDSDENDFLYYMAGDFRDYIIEDYPEKYKEYIIKKDAQKYNI